MTLRELVAQAIYESYQLIKPAPVAWEDLTEPLKPLYCEAASAAIACVLAALKEPSEMMIMAGRLENGYVITDIVRTKQEMSDEILSIRYRAMLAAFTRDLGTPGEAAPPRREGS